MDEADRGGRITRRRLLAAGSAAVLAGCTDGSGGGSSGEGSGDGEGTDASTGSAGDGESTPTPYGERLPSPVAGDPDAEVTLAVFEDYACPHCADYNAEGFPELDAEYVSTGEIRYEHRDLPIPVADPGSFQAANAARAVQHRHGDEAFWPYSEAIFERHGDIGAEGPDLFATLAEERGHDPEMVREAAVHRIYRETVRADRQEGIDLGVEATPTFVLDDEIVASGYGSGTVETVVAAIEEALSETG